MADSNKEILNRVRARLRRPIRFIDNGEERVLSLAEASALLRRIKAAIAACDEAIEAMQAPSQSGGK